VSTAAKSAPRLRRAAFLAAASLLLGGGGALAQSISVDLGQEGGSVSGQVVRLVLLLTVLSLAPSILVMVTSFTRIVIVLSFLRTAIGLQQTPPNAVGLALFLTVFIMAPTLETAYREGLQPMLEEEIDEAEALSRASAPLRAFMLRQVRPDDVALFVEIARQEPPASPDQVSLRVLLPAFMISELRRCSRSGSWSSSRSWSSTWSWPRCSCRWA
jgi:flagellar biosynthesis protein FliP